MSIISLDTPLQQVLKGNILLLVKVQSVEGKLDGEDPPAGYLGIQKIERSAPFLPGRAPAPGSLRSRLFGEPPAAPRAARGAQLEGDRSLGAGVVLQVKATVLRGRATPQARSGDAGGRGPAPEGTPRRPHARVFRDLARLSPEPTAT